MGSKDDDIATLWKVLRMIRVQEALPGYGRLLAEGTGLGSRDIGSSRGIIRRSAKSQRGRTGVAT